MTRGPFLFFLSNSTYFLKLSEKESARISSCSTKQLRVEGPPITNRLTSLTRPPATAPRTDLRLPCSRLCTDMFSHASFFDADAPQAVLRTSMLNAMSNGSVAVDMGLRTPPQPQPPCPAQHRDSANDEPAVVGSNPDADEDEWQAPQVMSMQNQSPTPTEVRFARDCLAGDDADFVANGTRSAEPSNAQTDDRAGFFPQARRCPHTTSRQHG